LYGVGQVVDRHQHSTGRQPSKRCGDPRRRVGRPQRYPAALARGGSREPASQAQHLVDQCCALPDLAAARPKRDDRRVPATRLQVA
jgi:hypothetical protein